MKKTSVLFFSVLGIVVFCLSLQIGKTSNAASQPAPVQSNALENMIKIGNFSIDKYEFPNKVGNVCVSLTNGLSPVAARKACDICIARNTTAQCVIRKVRWMRRKESAIRLRRVSAAMASATCSAMSGNGWIAPQRKKSASGVVPGVVPAAPNVR